MLTRLVPETGQQLDLFEDTQKRICSEQLNEAKLKLNERFGRTTVQSGATLLAATAKPKGDGRRLQSLL
jgi:hypothetical protein